MADTPATRSDGDSWDLASSVGATWQATVHTTPELYARNGFTFPEGSTAVAFGDVRYVSAELR